jgi:hypothetical protein
LERKKALFKLLRKAWGGIEYVEHLTGDGAVISTTPAAWARGYCLQADRLALPVRPFKELDQGEEQTAPRNAASERGF